MFWCVTNKTPLNCSRNITAAMIRMSTVATYNIRRYGVSSDSTTSFSRFSFDRVSPRVLRLPCHTTRPHNGSSIEDGVLPAPGRGGASATIDLSSPTRHPCPDPLSLHPDARAEDWGEGGFARDKQRGYWLVI